METAEAMRTHAEMLKAGDPRAWEVGYYATLFPQTMQSKGTFPIFDYDYAHRPLLYAFAHEERIGDRPIDYLEFGVFKGDSLRFWARHNRHPESRFFGFDSFEGLPEDWETGQKKKGDFSTSGQVPDIGDPRVQFVKGWFNTTLAPFMRTFERRNHLVLHMDADLFSSTLYALMLVDQAIHPGTVILFDDFNLRDDFAAFHHYCRACGREWRVIAARRGLGKLAAEIV